MNNLFRALILWLTGLPPIRRLVLEHRLGQLVAQRFVAGSLLDQGMAAAESLAGEGIGAMLDHLGENVATAEQAAAATDQYIGALKRIRARRDLGANIAVKLTQLGLDLSTELAAENMERVLAEASKGGAPILVMIDMESHEYVDRTLEVYLALRERHPNVGVAIQSYLHRTPGDIERIDGPKAIVRMVKGAYLEPAGVALRRMADIRASFVRLTVALWSSGATVHVATHDRRLISGAKKYVHRARVPRSRYEFQMLYGIRRDIQGRLRREGEPVRVYVPYGTQWYPYLTRRLAERPANIWFFASNLLRWRA
jgi:proline dehydrogenase